MFQLLVLTLGFCVTTVIAPSRAGGAAGEEFRCTTAPTLDFLSAISEMAVYERSQPHVNMSAAGVVAPLVVDTYFHVVAKDETPEGGYLSLVDLETQLHVLNHDFGPHGITFLLKGVDRMVHQDWAFDFSSSLMRKTLRRGGYNALNVYFQYELLNDSWGWCYLPAVATPDSAQFYLDGCAIKYSTLPGGIGFPYNLGKTATHEVGHWFGLLHTFEGYSCSGDGDFVADTPMQSSPTRGCPIGRDTCPQSLGLDPINNYMDYSDDDCYIEFTQMQVRRMLNMFTKYRALR